MSAARGKSSSFDGTTPLDNCKMIFNQQPSPPGVGVGISEREIENVLLQDVRRIIVIYLHHVLPILLEDVGIFLSTCRMRVVRFYESSSPLPLLPSPSPPPAQLQWHCRTSTAIKNARSHAK